MKVINSLMASALLLSSATAFATPVLEFSSGLDDICVDCTLSSQTESGTTSMDGASWIQDADAYGWDNAGESYTITESSFTSSFISGATDILYTVTSLYVAYDDTLTISVDDSVIFDSSDYVNTQPWLNTFDVIGAIGEFSFLASDDFSSFVVNTGNGPTGVIYSGTATASVPEPASIALLGLGLLGFGMSRRNKASAK
jgi:hypothetical protein